MFRDRHEAGRLLAAELEPWRWSDPVIVGLPRGGVVVAAEVASMLQTPLDVIVVKKVGAPGQPELAVGAVGEGGATVWNAEVVRLTRLTGDRLAELAGRATREVDERVGRFRAGRAPIPLGGRTVIVVDDGLATGATARAAAQVAAARGAEAVIIAVPVGAPATITALADVADEVIALEAPPDLRAVGLWYDDFTQISDQEVVELLHGAAT